MDQLTITQELLDLDDSNLNEMTYFIIRGHGGVGKTYLLQKFKERLEGKGTQCIVLDCDLYPTVTSIIGYLASTLLIAGYSGTMEATLRSASSSSTEPEDYPLPALSSIHDLVDLPLFEPRISTSEIQNGYVNTYEMANILGKSITEFSSEHSVTLLIDIPVPNEPLEIWIRILLDRIHSPLLVVIACRREMSPLWPYGSESSYIRFLEPFGLYQSMDFLKSQSIELDGDMIDEVFYLTKGYPLLLAHTALFIKSNPSIKTLSKSVKFKSSLSDRIRKCHLRELVDDSARNLTSFAAICRVATQDALEVVTNQEVDGNAYRSMVGASFMSEEPSGLGMLPVLREAIVEEWQTQSPKTQIELNRKLLAFYNDLRDTSNEEVLTSASIGALYHEMCIDEETGIRTACKLLFEFEELRRISGAHTILSDLKRFPYRKPSNRYWIHYWVATDDRLNNRFALAIPNYRAAIKHGKSNVLEGYGHYGLAEILKIQGSWASADNHLRSALNVFGSFRDRHLQLMSKLIRGNILIRQHDWEEARNNYTDALVISEEEDNPFGEFLVFINLGKLNRIQGMWEESQLYYMKAFDLAGEMDNSNYLAQIYYELGKFERDMGNLANATTHFKNSLQLWREQENQFKEAICLHSIGSLALQQNEISEAKEAFEESLSKKKAINDKYGMAKTINGLGHIERMLGNWKKSITHYKRAQTIYQKLGNRIKLSRILCRIGMTYAEHGFIDEAYDAIQKSKLIRIQRRDQQGVAESLFELGRLQNQQGQLEIALESFQLSSRIAENSQSFSRLIPPLVAKARTLALLDRKIEGVQTFQEARNTALKFNKGRVLAEEYFSWAEEDFSEGKIDVAFICYAEAIIAISHNNDYSVEYPTVLLSRLNELKDGLGRSGIERQVRSIISHWQTFGPSGGLLHLAIAEALSKIESNEWNELLIEAILQELDQTFKSNFVDRSRTDTPRENIDEV